MKIIAGLGNPGREYAMTRHNVGWWVVDHLADVWHFDSWKKDGAALVTTGLVGSHKVRLVKPQTYMNLSGDALKTYARRPFWSPATDLLVVVDEVALPVGRFRIRSRGSAGGHNGLKHIQHTLATQDYPRLRIGVGPGEERHVPGDRLADFVLSPFGKHEREEIVALMPTFTNLCDQWTRDGVEATMNAYNNN
jgi:PTH1 family peptidyl-tRNA hydrolase